MNNRNAHIIRKASVIHINLRVLILLGLHLVTLANAAEKFVIVIIDGARYTETFGDPTYTHIPKMASLAAQGTILTQFYNDSITYTSRAIPALWCGSWTGVQDTVYMGNNTQYANKPTIFEYFRKQKNLPDTECIYVLKYIQSLWLPSYHPQYGPSYWPKFHSQGSTDEQVSNQAQYVMNTHHPHFLWVYLADVDGAGHSGDWTAYTTAIQKADSIVGLLWDILQNDPFYQDSTYLFVTNDHGRHDNLHGGFSGHGDGCEGCRHIMFLALGPGIRQNFQSSQYRRIPDMAVTAGEILGLNPEYATGEVMNEILQPTVLKHDDFEAIPEQILFAASYPNPFNAQTNIKFTIGSPQFTELTIFDLSGKRVATVVSEKLPAGTYNYSWDADHSTSGIYFYRLNSGGEIRIGKLILIK